MEKLFTRTLTNRSQGVKIPVEDFIRSNLGVMNETISKMAGQISSVRLAAFLMDQPSFYNKDKFFNKLNQEGMCTIRYQNNRRARIVEIVKNVDQTAYIQTLHVFDQIKERQSKYKTPAVGKQVGGIVDMNLQLRLTGLDNVIHNSSDVAGMDASTQPFIGAMFPRLLGDFLRNLPLDHESYFCFGSEKVTIVNHVTGVNHSENMTGRAQNLFEIMARKMINHICYEMMFLVLQWR